MENVVEEVERRLALLRRGCGWNGRLLVLGKLCEGENLGIFNRKPASSLPFLLFFAVNTVVQSE